MGHPSHPQPLRGPACPSRTTRSGRRAAPLATALWLTLTLTVGCGSDDEPADTSTADTAVTDSGTAGGADTAADSGAADTGAAKKDTSSGVKCHPVNNTGCPAGQHCVWEGDVITCTDDGEHGAGEDCSDGKGCKIGVCVGVQGSDKSVCSPHCLADLECASSQCNKLTDSKGKVCDMGVTVAQCDPLAQNCSGAGQACYAGGQGFVCLAAGSVEAGQPCPEDNSCKAGHACVGKSTGSSGVCRKVCKIGGGSPSCDDITASCASLLGSATVGYCGS